MSDLAVLPPDDPAELGYPPTLPVELALRTAPVKAICESYGLSKDDWQKLKENPAFIAHVQKIVDALRRDGGLGFRLKAQLQAEELLKTSWRLVHSQHTPASVKADLIKFTVRAAGLDGSKEQAANATTALNIQINL